MKIRTACQDCQAGESLVKCFSQKHNKMTRVDFEPRSCQNSGSPQDYTIFLVFNFC